VKKLKEELFKLLPPTIYFFVALHIVAFVRVLMLKRTRNRAVVFHFHCRRRSHSRQGCVDRVYVAATYRFPHKPLIYNVTWKSVIYLSISMLIHYLERLFDFWRETGGFIAGNQKLLSEIIWPHFWAIQIILFVLIAMYCTVHELVSVIEKEKALRIFFRPMPAPEV